jgi:dTMP kinase
VFHSDWETSALVLGARRRGRKQHMFTPLTFSLLSATDFADRHDRQILPMLKAGFIVLCDGYCFTSIAADRARGVEPEWLRSLYGFAHKPDITFFLDLPLHAALDRVFSDREQLDWFDSGMDLGLSNDLHESFRLFQGRVLQEYERMIPVRGFDVLDAAVGIHELQLELRRRITATIDLAAFKQEAER